MKYVLTAVGSKYIHCNLAVLSLQAYARKKTTASAVEAAEYTINQNPGDILADLYRRRPDWVGFSCYIWNISMIKVLASDLHKILPQTEIWFGGPEASYDAGRLLTELPFLRGVMVGEGEETFVRLVRGYEAADDGASQAERDGILVKHLAAIPGIVWRSPVSGDTSLQYNMPAEVMDLSQVPFIYEHMQGDGGHKILYYESSRGCPFSCSYCLSSIDKKLRFRDWELVERELAFFLERRVPQVKFVDRTFNCRHDHALRIWHYLAEHDNGITNFHFEVSADLLNEEELTLLEKMRPGLVQLEIGVQSVNPDTLRAIRRTMDLERLRENVLRLGAAANIHLHLDLIAGLPWEDYESFGRSFDWVYGLHPEQLQLGFLKLLKGSCMQERAEEYGLICTDEPPYEVLSTRWLPYDDVCRLKQIEKVLEIYYNSGQFIHTMERLTAFYSSPFALYEELAGYFDKNGLFERQLGRPERFRVLARFLETCRAAKEEISFCFHGVAWNELLVYDYYLRENARVRPEFAPSEETYRDSITDWYAQAVNGPAFAGYAGFSYRQILHMTHAEVLSQDFLRNGHKRLIIFDYRLRDPLSGNASAWEAPGWVQPETENTDKNRKE